MSQFFLPSTSYIETHGTGTQVGDPIEIAALTQAFQNHTQKKSFCAIGSVKTNVGHLDAAAGVTGLIKTVLALKHKMLPPSLHFEQPNPSIDFPNTPFFVNNKLTEWESEDKPRRAGVSSFGIGGTNAHVVLEEAPIQKNSLLSLEEKEGQVERESLEKEGQNKENQNEVSLERESQRWVSLRSTHPTTSEEEKSNQWQLLVWSAKTASALESATTNLANYLGNNPNSNLADVAYTLSIGRKTFEQRRMLVCQTVDEARQILNAFDLKRIFTQAQKAKERPVVFMFSGQGSQYVNMGLELYQIEHRFREQVDVCADILKPHLELDIREILFPSAEKTNEAIQQLGQTAITQPALFVLEYALAQLWISYGIRPQAMIGHSIGEYVAACLAGVFSLEDALALVATRGRMMQQVPTGAMLSVPLPESEVQSFLTPELSLAAHNTPSLCVVSGTFTAIATLEEQLTAQGIECMRLHTSHAFHSGMMAAILEPFTTQVQKIQLNAPTIPYVSNVTGTWITATEATDPHYWAKHIRYTVRFTEGLQALLNNSEYALLEIGPGRTLTTLAQRHPNKPKKQVALTSVRHPKDHESDVAFLLTTLGKLWLAGVPIDWTGFYAKESRQRIPLPTYPFERQRYWIEPVRSSADQLSTQKTDIADWFYVPTWQREIAPISPAIQERENWLVFTDDCGLGTQLVKRLEQTEQQVITVCTGTNFIQLSESVYSLNPQQADQYETLLSELALQDQYPKMIVHCWSVTEENEPLSENRYQTIQQLGFYSLLYLAKALDKQDSTAEVQIEVVSNQIQAVTGEEFLCPEKATILGPVKVIPQEYPNIHCHSIDIVLPKSGSEAQLIEQLLAELTHHHENYLLPVAFRGYSRWEQSFATQRLNKPANNTIGLRKQGVYLITGGLGAIGLIFAEYLAKTVQAKLVLISRSGLPPREEWNQYLSDDNSSSSKQPRITVDMANEVEAIHQIEAALKAELGIKLVSSYPGLETQLNELCSSYLYDYFAHHINNIETGLRYSRVALKQRLNILPQFGKFYDFMLRVLAEDGLIQLDATQIHFLKSPTAIKNPKQLYSTLEHSYPEFAGVLGFLEHCVSHYSKALSGEIEAIGVLYPEGRADLLKQAESQSVNLSNQRLYASVLRDIIAKLIQNSYGKGEGNSLLPLGEGLGMRANDKRLRILEVGGGNGHLTKILLPLLSQHNVEYHFTDLGKSFVITAKENFKAFSNMLQFGVLDISKDPITQGYDYYSFDIILGFNVVHATPNIGETVEYLKKLLAPHGLLCLLETIEQQRWVDMVWGLAEGWWYFEDSDIRTDSPLLTISQWEAVLEKQGFQSVNAYPQNMSQREETDVALFIAQNSLEGEKPESSLNEAQVPSPFDKGGSRSVERLSALRGTDNETQRLQNQIRQVVALENLGAEVMVLRADVANLTQMQSVYTQATAQFGEIHGVIHTAVIKGGATIRAKAAEIAEQEFSPKIKGTRTLETLFKTAKLDFMMLCSSQNAIIGGNWMVGYCAASAFLDAFAQAKANELDTFIFSINWDRWQGIGRAVDVETGYQARTGKTLTGGLTAQEGMEVFHRILAKRTLPQVIISKQFDFAALAKNPNSLFELFNVESSKTSKTYTRTTEQNTYVVPRNEMEQNIAHIWQETLGIESIGIHEDFYDLGGDSLIAIRVVSRLRELYHIELPVRVLFEKTTIAELTDYIKKTVQTVQHLTSSPTDKNNRIEGEL